MSPRYLRLPTDRRTDLQAALVSGALGTAVGLVAFYLVRLLVAREPVRGPRAELTEAPRPED